MIKNKIKYKINFFRISILSIVGIIHGLTNSGGTLMSLALSTNNKKEYARYNLTFLYLVLASFQYLITIIIFNSNFIFPYDKKLILTIIFKFFIGNILNNYINNKKYKVAVNILVAFTSIILISS